MELKMKVNEKRILLVFAVAYAITFVAFYPQFYYTPDEQQYLRGSFLLMKGSFWVDDAAKSYGYAWNGSHYVSQYPPGQSAWILPFALAGWQFAFLSGLAAHLLGFYVFYRILKKLNYSGLYALLFLFFPAFVFQSKTLLSETLSILLVLVAFYFYLGSGSKKQGLLAGAFFGASMLVRYTNALVFLPFAVFALWKNRGKFLQLALGFAPFAAIALLYNFFVYGGFLTTGYAFNPDISFAFDPALIAVKFVEFAALLSIIYPLMFFSQFLYKGKARDEIIAAVLLLTLVFSAYNWNYIQFRPEDLLIGARFLAPVIPLLMLAYIPFIEKISEKMKIKRGQLKLAGFAAVLLLFAASAAVQWQYSQLIENKWQVFQEIYSGTNEGSLIVAETDIGKVPSAEVSGFVGMFFMEQFGNRRVVSIEGDYEKCITCESNTYYMRMWFEGRQLKVEIIPWLEYEGAGR